MMAGKKCRRILVAENVLQECITNGSESENYLKMLVRMKESQEFELYAMSNCLTRIEIKHGEARRRLAEQLVNKIIDIHEDITAEARKFCQIALDSAEELICARDHNFYGILTLNPQNYDVALTVCS